MREPSPWWRGFTTYITIGLLGLLYDMKISSNPRLTKAKPWYKFGTQGELLVSLCASANCVLFCSPIVHCVRPERDMTRSLEDDTRTESWLYKVSISPVTVRKQKCSTRVELNLSHSSRLFTLNSECQKTSDLQASPDTYNGSEICQGVVGRENR